MTSDDGGRLPVDEKRFPLAYPHYQCVGSFAYPAGQYRFHACPPEDLRWLDGWKCESCADRKGESVAWSHAQTLRDFLLGDLADPTWSDQQLEVLEDKRKQIGGVLYRCSHNWSVRWEKPMPHLVPAFALRWVNGCWSCRVCNADRGRDDAWAEAETLRDFMREPRVAQKVGT